MQLVQIEAEPRVAELGGRFLLNIYDSLVAEIPPGVGEKLGQIIQEVVDGCSPYPWVRHVVESKRWS
jgi:Mrp family chromosome partitioning ATPase